MGKLLLCFAVALTALLLVGIANAGIVTVYDSNGFESSKFVLGNLKGQDGWAASSNGELKPVVESFGVCGGQSVKLGTKAVSGYLTGFERNCNIPLDVSSVFVSFDIFRPENAALRLYWYGVNNKGNQSMGVTMPFVNGLSSATQSGKWTNLTMQWDLNQKKAYTWYGGTQVDSGLSFTNPPNFSYYGIYAIAQNAEDIWIDNFVITASVNDVQQSPHLPEASSFALALSSLPLIGGYVIRRRK